MRRPTDDMENWKLQQENRLKPFPYVFPQMPPKFGRYQCFIQTLFLMEWGSYLAIFFIGFVAASAMLILGRESFLESRTVLLAAPVFVVCLPLGFLCRWLRHTPKFFWRCPCCGRHFPYYAPPLCGMDELKEADCLYSMKRLRIRYVKTRFCPLIIPSVCPECGCRFFDMGEEKLRNK